jgi:thymidine kinase
MLNSIRDNNYNSCDYETIVVIQEIERKIYSYKQQDFKKKILDKSKVVELQNVVDKMLEIELTCYYCKDKMSLLYEMAREQKQWTIDRIDNDIGHNKDNFVLACLDCNLKRRRKSKDSFLFTKQMNIIKQDNTNNTDTDNIDNIDNIDNN